MQCGDEAIVLGSTWGKKWLIIEKEAENSGAWRSQYCKIVLISWQKQLEASNLTLVCHILDHFKFSFQGKIRCWSYRNKYLPKCRRHPSRFVSFKQVFYFHLSFVPLHFTTSNDCGIQDKANTVLDTWVFTKVILRNRIESSDKTHRPPEGSGPRVPLVNRDKLYPQKPFPWVEPCPGPFLDVQKSSEDFSDFYLLVLAAYTLSLPRQEQDG